MSRVMIAQGLVDTWNRIIGDIVDSAWEIFDPFWMGGEPADDDRIDLDDSEYRQIINVRDVKDM
jgi:hypothetical protein